MRDKYSLLGLLFLIIFTLLYLVSAEYFVYKKVKNLENISYLSNFVRRELSMGETYALIERAKQNDKKALNILGLYYILDNKESNLIQILNINKFAFNNDKKYYSFLLSLIDDKVKYVDRSILQDIYLIKDDCKSEIVFALKIKQKNDKVKMFQEICNKFLILDSES